VDRLLLTRRQILKAAGVAGLVSAAGLALVPIRSLADDQQDSLGPFGPWAPPEPILELTSPFDDYHPATSNDDLNLYFTSTRPWALDAVPGHNHIWLSTRRHRHAPWGDPVVLQGPMNVPSVNSGIPNLSPDQLTLYFNGALPGGCGFSDLWLVRRDDQEDNSAWGQLTNLGPGVNSSHPDAGPSFFVDPMTDLDHVYFTRFAGIGPGSSGGQNEDWDIYDSVRDASGAFVASALPIPNLSLPKTRDTRTAVRRDALEILITTNRPRVAGVPDPVVVERLWVSTRPDTASEWALPVLANDGARDAVDGINSGLGDGGPALSRNGTRLYFFSQRTAAGTQGKRQLWMSKRGRQEHSVHEAGHGIEA
jgi:hypothetical protein